MKEFPWMLEKTSWKHTMSCFLKLKGGSFSLADLFCVHYFLVLLLSGFHLLYLLRLPRIYLFVCLNVVSDTYNLHKYVNVSIHQ